MSAVQPDTRRHRALAAQSRVDLLAALRAAEHALTVGEAAAAVGLHPNTARVHLEQLVAVGLVARRSEGRSVPGRPRSLYAPVPGAPDSPDGPDDHDVRAAPQGSDPPDEGYRTLASLLAGELAAAPQARRVAIEAGRRWAAGEAEGAWSGSVTGRDAVQEVSDLLHRLGFRPEIGPDGTEILLHRCPFEDVARQSGSVVCGVHLGLIEGSFGQLGDEIEVTGLEPFRSRRPLLCAVRLRRRGASQRSPGPGAQPPAGSA